MILSFSQFFDKKKTKPTYFQEKILNCATIEKLKKEDPNKCGFPVDYSYPTLINGEMRRIPLHPKLHTIRQGHRWKEGDLIHMAYGVRTKSYCQFNKGIPELQRVKGVQEIVIKYGIRVGSYKIVTIYIDRELFFTGYGVQKNGSFGCSGEDMKKIKQLTKNDGFDYPHDFFAWFNRDFHGQLLHWTDLKY